MTKITMKDLLESDLLKPIEKYSPSQITEEIKLLTKRIEALRKQYKETS